MRAAQLPELAIETFKYYYAKLLDGETGLIPEDEIIPIETLPDLEQFPPELAEVGQAALKKTVIIKLNGGLGTSMGLQKAKSLLPVKGDLTFLDIIARHALHRGAPLVLMNSFNTREDSLALLQRYPALHGDIPLDFLQHKVPKVVQSDFTPACWPQNPKLEWAPPGHGDFYTAMITSGMLQTLLDAGIEYAFVSNADNLGASLDPILLGYFIVNESPFMSEAADRTPLDSKGGHLALRPDGGLILRESAQCPPEDWEHYQDITRHRYFNANNLWMHLPTLKQVMEERRFILGLPMIRNAKTVDPRDPNSTPVYQLETAIGSAIGVFEGATAVRVPRTRFAPVKTTNQLLGVRSDAYILTEDYRVMLNPRRNQTPLLITLDDRFYKFIDALDARFPFGPPSLVDCISLDIRGDVRFGRDVKVIGSVTLQPPDDTPLTIPDHAVLHG
ncbi:MAG: UTP--glucose-1-phosphate uridylyltransferase [Chloroflexi bacterium]|nr:UTP--glucose-1-phosphate uridylyltransferase [Chloroflexota bacterium]